jgi:hypothetical protein
LWAACREQKDWDDEEDEGRDEGIPGSLQFYASFDEVPMGGDEVSRSVWRNGFLFFHECGIFWDLDYEEYPKLLAEGKTVWGSEEMMRNMGIRPDYYVPPPVRHPEPYLGHKTIYDRKFEKQYLHPIAKRIAARKILRFIVARSGNA